LKKYTRILAAVLVVVLLLALAACGGKTEPSPSPSPVETTSQSQASAPAASPSEEPSAAPSNAASFKTVEDGVLTMATNAEFPPYEYHEGDDIVGIDAEIAAVIAEKLGLELKISDMDFTAIIAAVQVIIVKEGSELTSVDDLFDKGGYTIGVQESTTGDLYTTWNLEDEGLATINRYNKGADAVQALITDKVDCVVIDNEPAKAYVAANPGLIILETEYIEEQYAIAYSKNNPELGKAVDAALQDLIKDGTVQKIIDKYIKA
jgi:polar amino acid transport system substrate-binding protein